MKIAVCPCTAGDDLDKLFRMNENKSTSVETDEIKREQAEGRGLPGMWETGAGPGVKREEERLSPDPGLGAPSPAESIPQISSEMSFACILIPRFSDHYLAGDIVERLTEWMKQVCVSYGWRLEALSIRPGYMQWVMRVPLNANPAQFMRLTRRHTSGKIFEEFPRFRRENVSGEFWAPGNFVFPGDQLQAPETINTMILQTRRGQGLV